jgi:EAL domain-containing protein (putative c-di-GMP-specific phosphodiesterase class I)
LYYQPKVNITTGAIAGVEALLRWNEPESGIVLPSRFIPILEETGMILDVGRWALAEAAEVHRKWKAAGLDSGRIAVNVSALQLRQKDFVTIVEETTASADGEIGIDIEITETMLMQDITHSLSVLGAIRNLGVMIAIDDFGTGYSSLSYLARLPIDYLKIDRSFINKIVDRSDDLEIASAIISMANSLSLKTIAEGVETREQADLLKALGCHQMQGYLISKPLPEEKVIELFS